MVCHLAHGRSKRAKTNNKCMEEQSHSGVLISPPLISTKFSSPRMTSSRSSREGADQGFTDERSALSSPERSALWSSESPERIYNSSKGMVSPGTALGVASSRVQLVEKERKITAALCRDLAQLITSSRVFALPSDDRIIPVIENGTTFRDLSLLLARLRRRLHAFEQVVLAQEAQIALLEMNAL